MLALAGSSGLLKAAAPPSSRFAPELPAEVLHRILGAPSLCGDAATLCAAACVSRSWRAAAASPPLWRHFGPLSPRAAARLSDATLATLVSRAGGAPALVRADLTDCERITDDGLAEALLPHARSLTRVLLNGCTALTARGVLHALQGAQLAHLGVRGVRAMAHGDKNYFASRRYAEARQCSRLLAASLAPEAAAAWKVGLCEAKISTVTGMSDPCGDNCARLYDETNHSCCACYTLFCIVCERRLNFSKCYSCDTEMCSDCMNAAEDRTGFTCGICFSSVCPACYGGRCDGGCGLKACWRCAASLENDAHGNSDGPTSFTCRKCSRSDDHFYF